MVVRRQYDNLNFTSEIAFRNEFEERYRSRRDRGEKTHIVVIVHSSQAARHLPYDLEKKSRVIEVGLHQVFLCLNRIVLADLDRRYYPALFQAHATLEQDNAAAHRFPADQLRAVYLPTSSTRPPSCRRSHGN